MSTREFHVKKAFGVEIEPWQQVRVVPTRGNLCRSTNIEGMTYLVLLYVLLVIFFDVCFLGLEDLCRRCDENIIYEEFRSLFLQGLIKGVEY